MKKLDAIIIQAVVREVDADGNTTSEQVSSPVKLFKTAVPDVWQAVEQSLVEPTPPQES